MLREADVAALARSPASCNFLLAEPLDGVILMSFVVVVIAISIYQEHKTENALAALRDLSSPRALVVRDGQQRPDRRPRCRPRRRRAARRRRSGARRRGAASTASTSRVDESALTGEAVPVRKTTRLGPDAAAEEMGAPGGDATPVGVLRHARGQGPRHRRSSSARASGTELGRIGTALRTIEPERTPLQRELDRLVRIIAVCGAGRRGHRGRRVRAHPCTTGWRGCSPASATAMAMLPEEFPVVLTVFLALGAWRMSQRHVLTRRSAVIETLGSATVVCVDKTGTLTMNAMTVRDADGRRRVTTSLDGDPLPERVPRARRIRRARLAASTRSTRWTARSGELGERLPRRHRAPPQRLGARPRVPAVRRPARALARVAVTGPAPTTSIAAKGAPEAIADLCHLDARQLAALDSAGREPRPTAGLRVLAVARAAFSHDARAPDRAARLRLRVPRPGRLHDPVRPGVADAVAELPRAPASGS